ncbi:MAG: hypothetical protein AB1512_17150 [Thermodesulfobacteriota bacterium]
MLQPLFWDCDYSQITWTGHRDLILSRVLSSGTWEAVRWLRKTLGDKELREYIVACRGRRLSPRQLRFWELILGIPHRTVSAWLKDPGRTVWDRRHAA